MDPRNEIIAAIENYKYYNQRAVIILNQYLNDITYEGFNRSQANNSSHIDLLNSALNNARRGTSELETAVNRLIAYHSNSNSQSVPLPSANPTINIPGVTQFTPQFNIPNQINIPGFTQTAQTSPLFTTPISTIAQTPQIQQVSQVPQVIIPGIGQFTIPQLTVPTVTQTTVSTI